MDLQSKLDQICRKKALRSSKEKDKAILKSLKMWHLKLENLARMVSLAPRRPLLGQLIENPRLSHLASQ